MLKILAIILAIHSFSVLAHNMPERVKRYKIIDAIKGKLDQAYLEERNIKISPTPFSPDIELQLARFESGDQDLDKIEIKFYQREIPYLLSCTLLSGEYGRDGWALYFLKYKDCKLKNLYTSKERSIELNTKPWKDWKY